MCLFVCVCVRVSVHDKMEYMFMFLKRMHEKISVEIANKSFENVSNRKYLAAIWTDVS